MARIESPSGVPANDPLPVRIRKYLGFRFLELADDFDFRLGRPGGLVTHATGIFTVLVVVAVVLVGILVQVHVKVPVSGQMTPKTTEVLTAKFKGRVEVLAAEGQSNLKVEAGQLLLRVSPQEHRKMLETQENDLRQAEERVAGADKAIENENHRLTNAQTSRASLDASKTNKERERGEQERAKGIRLQEFENRLRQAQELVTRAARKVEEAKAQLETLARKEPLDLQNADQDIAAAQTDFNEKERNYGTEERLDQKGVGKKQDLASAKAAFDLARTKLDQSRTAKERLKIDLERQALQLQGQLAEDEASLGQRKLDVTTIEIERDKYGLEWTIADGRLADEIERLRFQIEEADTTLASARTGIESAQRQKNAASGDVANKKIQVEKTAGDLEAGAEIRAPFDGYVQEILVKTGEEVQAGQALLKLGSTDLEFVGTIESRHLDRAERAFAAGQRSVRIRFEEFQKGGSQDVEHRGEVAEVTRQFVAEQGPGKGAQKKMWVVKIQVLPPVSADHAGMMPDIGYSGSGNILTEEMSLFRYWVFHKILKKI